MQVLCCLLLTGDLCACRKQLLFMRHQIEQVYPALLASAVRIQLPSR